MSLDAAVLKEPQAPHDSFSRAIASDPAASILKHAVKIWARDHGIAEDDLPRLINLVLEFANSTIRDCARKAQPDA